MIETEYNFLPTLPVALTPPPGTTEGDETTLLYSYPGAAIYESKIGGATSYVVRDTLAQTAARFILLSDAITWLCDKGYEPPFITSLPDNWNLLPPEVTTSDHFRQLPTLPIKRINPNKRRKKIMKTTLIYFIGGHVARMAGWNLKPAIVDYCNSHQLFDRDITPQDIVGIRFRITKSCR